MATRTTGRVVGACFLLAFYIVGGMMVDAGSGNPAVLSRVPAHRTLIATGALLMLVNSVAAAAIGVLMFPVLRRRHEVSAHGYLVCLSVAAVMLSVGTVFLLLLIPLGRETSSGGGGPDLPAVARVVQQGNFYAYQVGMLAWSIGGLVLCRVLLRAGLVPRPLALLGLVGYAAFLAGSVLEVLGHSVGNALSVPGGLFEVSLGVLLIARGFSGPDGDGADRGASREVDLRAVPTLSRL